MSEASAAEPRRDYTILIIFYLLAPLVFATYSIASRALDLLPQPYAPLKVPLMCGAIAYVGGALYCYRSIYLNKCAYERWDSD